MTYPKFSFLISVLFIALFCMVGGCSPAYQAKLDAFGEWSGTDRYWAQTKAEEHEVHVSESPAGVRDHFGYLKRLTVHNPLHHGINVQLSCSSMFQNDDVVHVRAHSNRTVFISGTRELDQTCFIGSYEHDGR